MKVKKHHFLIVLLILLLDNSLAQNTNPNAVFAGIGYGGNDYHLRGNLDFVRKSYGNADELNRDYSSFNNDTNSDEFLKQLGFYFGFCFNMKERKIFNPRFKADFGISVEDIANGYLFKKTFYGSGPGVPDTLNTQELVYSLSNTLYHTGISALFYSKIFGKKLCLRFYAGMGLQFGIGKQSFGLTYKNRLNMAYETEEANTYSIVGNAIKDDVVDIDYSRKIPLYNYRANFHLGFEYSFSEQKFFIFTEVRLGISTYKGKNIGSVTGNSTLVVIGFRYVYGT